MHRACHSLIIALLIVLSAGIAEAVTILPGEIEHFGSPCTLSISQSGSVRTLSWSTVLGANTYKVGYRLNGSIVALAEVTGSSYDHVGWSGSDCLEYVMVACDGSGMKICAAHRRGHRELLAIVRRPPRRAREGPGRSPPPGPLSDGRKIV